MCNIENIYFRINTFKETKYWHIVPHSSGLFIICKSLCKNPLNPLELHGNLKKKWIPLVYVYCLFKELILAPIVYL